MSLTIEVEKALDRWRRAADRGYCRPDGSEYTNVSDLERVDRNIRRLMERYERLLAEQKRANDGEIVTWP